MITAQTNEDVLTLVELSEQMLALAITLKQAAFPPPAARALRLIPSAGSSARDDMQLLSSLAASYAAEVADLGDTVSALASGTLRLRDEGSITLLQAVTHMASRTAWLLQQALAHFLVQDVNIAHSLIQQACLVRSLYRRIYDDALDYAAACPGSIAEAGMILSTASNFECTARYVIRVCEQTTRAIAGEGAATRLDDTLPASTCGWAAAYADSCAR